MFQGVVLDLADAFLAYAIIHTDAGKGVAAPIAAQAEAPGNHNPFAVIELSESLLEYPSEVGCFRGTCWRLTGVRHEVTGPDWKLDVPDVLDVPGGAIDDHACQALDLARIAGQLAPHSDLAPLGIDDEHVAGTGPVDGLHRLGPIAVDGGDAQGGSHNLHAPVHHRPEALDGTLVVLGIGDVGG